MRDEDNLLKGLTTRIMLKIMLSVFFVATFLYGSAFTLLFTIKFTSIKPLLFVGAYLFISMGLAIISIIFYYKYHRILIQEVKANAHAREIRLNASVKKPKELH